MNTFFTNLILSTLQSAMSALLMRIAEIDFNVVKTECLNLWNSDLSGDEKRKLVYARLREMSSVASSWILNAAIEIAVGKLQAEFPKLEKKV